MRKIVIVLLGSVGLVVLSGCQEVAPRAEQASATEASGGDATDRFVGTWKLVGVERIGADGELLPAPEPPAFGSPEPIGFIMYGPGGYMGVVIMQSGRQPYAGDQRTPEEARALLTSYTSYFGTFTVNEADGFVTHHVEGNLNPGGVGADNKRFFEFLGNRLILKPPPGVTGVQLRLIWERVPDLAELTPEHRRFIGFWRIGSIERRTADGALLPSNQYQTGFITYTASGHMAVHLMRPGRTSYAAAQPTPGEAQTALTTYGSYFGPYTIHEAEGYVVHHRIGSLNPGSVGTDAQRLYEMTRDQLILKPPPATVDGQPVQSALTWERLSTDVGPR